MNLDELKSAWQKYDLKLQTTQALSSRLINSMITERSSSRLSKVRQRYIYGFLYMGGWLLFGFAILWGNPFDYKQSIEFIPTGISCMCIFILLISMLKSYSELKGVEMSTDNIQNALKKIIEIYERPGKFLDWTLRVLLFSSIVLFPLSFLPRHINRLGVWRGIAETCIAISIAAVIVFVAHKMGAFKERQGEKFRQDLKELNALKEISQELAG